LMIQPKEFGNWFTHMGKWSAQLIDINTWARSVLF